MAEPQAAFSPLQRDSVEFQADNTIRVKTRIRKPRTRKSVKSDRKARSWNGLDLGVFADVDVSPEAR